MPPTERLAYDYAGAAEQLGVSARTVRRMVAAGELPTVGVWGMRRITHRALLAYLDGLEQPSNARRGRTAQ
jgi:excisionase family DNA binding protein